MKHSMNYIMLTTALIASIALCTIILYQAKHHTLYKKKTEYICPMEVDSFNFEVRRCASDNESSVEECATYTLETRCFVKGIDYSSIQFTQEDYK